MTDDAALPRETLERLVRRIVDDRQVTASGLTERERRVLQLIAEGHGNADIAQALNCSPHTVKNIIYDLMGRLQLRNRTHAAAYAVRAGII